MSDTGDRYPRGKLRDSDEGETQIEIHAEDRTVIMSFTKPIYWLGMPASMARSLATALLAAANRCDDEPSSH